MVRLNITMPEEVAEKLRHIANKSQFIAQAVREKFSREKRRELERLLAESYQKAAQEDMRANRDWENPTLTDGWK